MKKCLAFIATSALALSANASTKYIECKQSDEKGVVQIINATIDDASDKAEVQLYATTAGCAKNQTCGTEVYKKEVLPTVLRLTSVTIVRGLSYTNLSYTKIIDIDRKDLGVVTRSSLKSSVGNSETTHTGSCEVKKVDQSTKLL